jgi:hypothetical protein
VQAPAGGFPEFPFDALAHRAAQDQRCLKSRFRHYSGIVSDAIVVPGSRRAAHGMPDFVQDGGYPIVAGERGAEGGGLDADVAVDPIRGGEI